eukprot:356704-Chlamydomonas_euryale.AAC.22
MFFTLQLRPKQPADRLLCLAVVTRHHLILLSLRTRLLRALRPGVAHGASPHSAAGSGAGADPAPSPLFPNPLQPRDALPTAAACSAAYQGPASA